MSTVFAPKLQPGDRIADYEDQVGAITRIYRDGLITYTAETESGTDLWFFPWHRPTLTNR